MLNCIARARDVTTSLQGRRASGAGAFRTRRVEGRRGAGRQESDEKSGAQPHTQCCDGGARVCVCACVYVCVRVCVRMGRVGGKADTCATVMGRV